MNLVKAIKIIKSLRKKYVFETKHFKDQCLERNIDVNTARELIKTKELLGILEQGENTYKIWYHYNKDKDLNIILRIMDEKKLRLITIFLCSSERRKR